MANRVFNKVKIKVDFTESANRVEIQSGEQLPTLMGKIKKYFTDMKSVAFTAKYSDLTGYPTKLSEFENDTGFKTTDNNTWKANTKDSEGYVAKGSGQARMVWKTDANGVPGWREAIESGDSVGKMVTYDIEMPIPGNAVGSANNIHIYSDAGYKSQLPVIASQFALSDKVTGGAVDLYRGGSIHFYTSNDTTGANAYMTLSASSLKTVGNLSFESTSTSAGIFTFKNNVTMAKNLTVTGNAVITGSLDVASTLSSRHLKSILSSNSTNTTYDCNKNKIADKNSNPIFVDGSNTFILQGISFDNELCFYSATNFDNVYVYGKAYVGDVSFTSGAVINPSARLLIKDVYDIDFVGNSGGYDPELRFYSGTTDQSTTASHSAIIGNTMYARSFNSGNTTADYAEYLEWKDKNLNDEDRVGRFVTFSEDKIVVANAGDFVIGAVSTTSAIIGACAYDEWGGKYQRDKFGRYILGDVESVDPETGEITVLHDKQLLNEDYDESLQYIPRAERPEWDPIGLLGVLHVYDDGTCEPDGWCKVADNGIATAATPDEWTFLTPVFKVLKRTADDVIQIFFK